MFVHACLLQDLQPFCNISIISFTYKAGDLYIPWVQFVEAGPARLVLTRKKQQGRWVAKLVARLLAIDVSSLGSN
jgi:hypothetical protein